MQKAVATGPKHVVLTGGEPLLPRESVQLCTNSESADLHVTIETAGTIDRELSCDLMSISPKLAGSTPDATKHARWSELHEQRRMPIATIKRLIERSRDFQLKFVVDSPADYDEISEIVSALDVQDDDVWIMPQGSTIEAIDRAIGWLKPWAQSQGFHYCDRMQIRWFGNRRGT